MLTTLAECDTAVLSPIEKAIIVAVVITPFDMLLTSLATCECAQKLCWPFRYVASSFFAKKV